MDGGVPGRGSQRVGVLLNGEMDDAVVGETEEEGDEEEDDKDGTLQDSLRMARSPFTPRRGGGRPDTPARELRRPDDAVVGKTE